jgi:hypothetical protein
MSSIDDLLSILADEINVTDSAPAKEYDTPGRGRKQCPQCKVYVGVRTHDCSCGHSFAEKGSVASQAKLVAQPEMDEETKNYILGLNIGPKRVLIVYTPAGVCPYKLDSVDYDSVKSFCEDVVDAGLKEGRLYTKYVINYWLGKQLGWFTTKHKAAINFVNQWVAEVTSNEVVGV